MLMDRRQAQRTDSTKKTKQLTMERLTTKVTKTAKMKRSHSVPCSSNLQNKERFD